MVPATARSLAPYVQTKPLGAPSTTISTPQFKGSGFDSYMDLTLGEGAFKDYAGLAEIVLLLSGVEESYWALIKRYVEADKAIPKKDLHQVFKEFMRNDDFAKEEKNKAFATLHIRCLQGLAEEKPGERRNRLLIATKATLDNISILGRIKYRKEFRRVKAQAETAKAGL